MEDSGTLTYDTRSISTLFKNFLANIAESPLTKLPNLPGKYNLESAIKYYSSFNYYR